MTTTADLIRTIADKLDATVWTEARGNVAGAVRKGARAVEIRAQHDGTVRITTWIDYGDHGRSYCDGRDYRTAAGALRFARTFLKIGA